MRISFFLCNFAAEFTRKPNFVWRKSVGSLHIEIAFIDALYLTKRNFATFELKVKIKVTVDAYGYDNTLHCYMRQYSSSYQRRFPVVYLTFRAMRRPRLVNNQQRGLRFFVFVTNKIIIYGGCRKAK